MIPSGNLSFAKELWFDGCLGVERRRVGLALAEGLWDWWGSHFGWRPPWYTGICLKTKKTHGKPQSYYPNSARLLSWLGRLLETASIVLLRISPPLHREPLVATSAFKVAEQSSSPHQLTLSRKSQLVLWCGRRKMESPCLWRDSEALIRSIWGITSFPQPRGCPLIG
jgi:hypothetical protein